MHSRYKLNMKSLYTTSYPGLIWLPALYPRPQAQGRVASGWPSRSELYDSVSGTITPQRARRKKRDVFFTAHSCQGDECLYALA